MTCLTCGHEQWSHIYDVGACRPGFVCESRCEEFNDGKAKCEHIDFFDNSFKEPMYYAMGYTYCPKCGEKL
jgi:hypothetical protein